MSSLAAQARIEPNLLKNLAQMVCGSGVTVRPGVSHSGRTIETVNDAVIYQAGMSGSHGTEPIRRLGFDWAFCVLWWKVLLQVFCGLCVLAVSIDRCMFSCSELCHVAGVNVWSFETSVHNCERYTSL